LRSPPKALKVKGNKEREEEEIPRRSDAQFWRADVIHCLERGEKKEKRKT